MLCMAGTLTSLGRASSRLWSENFDDAFFIDGLRTWLETGRLEHDTSYLHAIPPTHAVMKTPAGAVGARSASMCCGTRTSSACSTRCAWA